MLTKYIVVVSGEVDIRDYIILVQQILRNTDLKNDLLFTSGPLDVLDHSSDTFAYGGKLGIDATVKMPEEMNRNGKPGKIPDKEHKNELLKLVRKDFDKINILDNIDIAVVSLNQGEDPMTCVARGCGIILDDLEEFSDFLVGIEREPTRRTLS